MASKSLRIILDTNLWISFLITKDYSKLDKLLFSGKTTLIFSQELLSEFIAVAQRPKFRKYFSPEDLEDLLSVMAEVAEWVEVKTITKLCRDAKDDFLLSLAIDGKADFLITGDSDLLELNQLKKTKIITIADFLTANSTHR